jgi:hypothetical protein
MFTSPAGRSDGLAGHHPGDNDVSSWIFVLPFLKKGVNMEGSHANGRFRSTFCPKNSVKNLPG